MTIRIVRNSDGNCITFEGSSNPVYFNACLSGQVDPTFSDKINVINDIATAQAAETVYEFYQIDYTEFRDADNNPFATAADTAAYITAQGNVIAVAGATYLGTWDADSNTPTLVAATHAGNEGDFYYVSVDGTTSLDGVSSWKRGDKIIWNGSAWQKLQATSVIDGTTYSTLLNTQTSVYADGEGATADEAGIPGWYYRNTENNKINWYVYGDTPSIRNELDDLGVFYAVITPKNTTSEPYFSVYTKAQGDGNDQSWYRSRVTYYHQGNLQTMVAGTKYLVHSATDNTALLDSIDTLLPRISLGKDAATTAGPEGATEELFLMALSTSSNYPAGTNEFTVEKIGYVLGDHQQEFSLSSPPTTGASTFDVTPSAINFELEATGTTILANDGQQYSVNSIRALDNGDGTIDIVALPALQVIYDNLNHSNVTITGTAAGTNVGAAVNALNALFTNLPLGAGGTYQPTYPVLDATDITAETHNTTTPTTTKSDGTTVHLYGQTSTANNADVVWSTETIDAAGEFYLVKIAGGGRFLVGLGSESDGDRTELDALTGTATGGSSALGLKWSQAFYDYGSYTAPWTIYGSSPGLSYGPGWSFSSTDQQMRYNENVQGELNGAGAPGLRDGVLIKIGIDQNGYITCWYYDEGRSNEFIMTARSTTVTPAGNYFLVVKLWDGNNVMVELPQRSAVDPTAPVLNYRFIESPDGNFEYPLFATAEEANYVDTQNGGSGASHEHVYADEPTSTTWYMPDTGSTMTGTARPADTSEVVYAEIPTNADNLYAPSAFTIADLTVDEGATVNYQVSPQDAPYTTTVTGAPTGLTYSLGVLDGTAPEVTGDNVANPSDDYVITVTRTNDFGSTSSTFTLTVNNLTAPVIATGDWSVNSGTITAGVLQGDSSANLSFTMGEGERVIIPRQWVDAHLNANALATNENIHIGVLESSPSLGDISFTDFVGCIRWYGTSSTSSHGVTLFDELGGLTQSSYFTNSGSTSVYDYGLELHNGSLYLIACNVNSLNTEPAVAEGGSFTRTMNCGAISGEPLTAPLTITLATSGGVTVDLDDALTTEDPSKITIPSPPAPSITTSWTKALDFSGSAERTLTVNGSPLYTPLKMAGTSNTVAAPTAGQTVASGHPWATAIVFNPDLNNSNQHIWNLGEGAGTNDDNIYVRLSSNGQVYFGWGRDGALNECYLGSITGDTWYGLYIAFTGERLNGSNATANGLADCFDIRWVTLSSGTVQANMSQASNWTATGGRMDREFNGYMTVGGRNSNRSFHGKVASMVVTTLRCGVAMPTDAEIAEMVTDPMQWLTDYKVGQAYRRPSVTTTHTSNFALNSYDSSYGTQVWLMGDGTSDAFAQIRNQVFPAEQNRTPMNMISMVSNDIENVSISGLS